MSCSCDNNPLILPVGATGPQGPKGDKGDTGAGAFEHFIGEAFGGGVIFHVYKDSLGEEHGLIISLEEQVTTTVVYSDVPGISLGISFLESKWNGGANTNLMATQIGATEGAWKVCVDYSYDGFTDWYLPSVTECALIYQNRYNIFKTFTSIVGAEDLLDEAYYWTSTEVLNSIANTFEFKTGATGTTSKLSGYYVRAIRQF